MLMMVQPLRDAIHTAKAAAGEGAKVIYLSPQGRKLDQAGVSELATNQKLILVCGRYEGIDERVIQTEIDEEWSIGDYVLSGGELPAMTLIDSVSRFIPGFWVMKLRQRKIPLPMVCWTAHTIPALKC
nr:tRNA (Guanine37-N1) -methyltransferase [Raoultella sp. NCTC 9187]